MTLLNALTLTTFKPGTENAPHVRRRNKLIAKIEEQIKLANNPDYKPTKLIWHSDGEGIQHKQEIPKRIKRWWITQSDGTVLLTVRYGSRALELAKGKNAIVISSTAELPKVLETLLKAVNEGEFDALLESQASYTKLAKQKRKSE